MTQWEELVTLTRQKHQDRLRELEVDQLVQQATGRQTRPTLWQTIKNLLTGNLER